MDRNYLMVRAMTSQEVHFNEFFGNSVVAVGWSSVDFASFREPSEVREAVKTQYYATKSGPHVGKQLNECVRFKKIKSGDYIIVPYYSGIALAIAEAEELYSKNADTIDLSNQHKVTYLYKDGNVLSVPRDRLSEGLQRRLRVMGSSVSDLSEFAEEIDILFANPESYSYSEATRIKEDALEKEFKQYLLKNIQGGKTNLKTGGIGMENLVKELFICEGYDARVLPKTSFKGSADADIEAWRDDDFCSVKLYAQVKHHEGESGRDGIDQIIQAISDRNEKGENYKGLFITSAKISSEARKHAEDNDISVIDGDGIVDILYSCLDRLPKATIKKLGIAMVPSIVEI